MGSKFLVAVTLSAALLSVNAVPSASLIGSQGVNLWRLRQASQISPLFVQNKNENERLAAEFPPYKFEQPLDHFSNRSETFGQRYWISTRHYTPGSGGPVYVLDGGETSGEDRLQFLDTGIVDILSSATGGIGIVLEHRYYGDSVPVANFTTDSLRWLNNAQAAADSANFLANVKFPGIDEDLTAPNTPWIYYGGSYAGARAAHMKVLYPELVYGAIASSGVTHAAVENWEYFDIIRKAADPTCIANLESAISQIDTALSVPHWRNVVKEEFGLLNLTHDQDFVSLLQDPLGSWQSKNWNPAIGSTEFDEFCAALSPRSNDTTDYGELSKGAPDNSLFYYAEYIKDQYVSKCTPPSTVEDCFGTFDDTTYQGTSLDQTWRLWIFQVCTEWGYFSTAPPKGHPRIVSNLLDLKYQSQICHQAFPPGEYFTVPALPNVTAVNALGDFAIAADRLAIIDGEVDPWRPDTPHSEYAKDREDTLLRPFKLIPNGVHHYDEYGLANIADEPEEIRKIHGEMIAFVMEWLKDRKTN